MIFVGCMQTPEKPIHTPARQVTLRALIAAPHIMIGGIPVTDKATFGYAERDAGAILARYPGVFEIIEDIDTQAPEED